MVAHQTGHQSRPRQNKLMCYPEQRGRCRAFGYLPRNSQKPHQPSAPEPSGTSSAICAGTLWNLISFLPPNPPEPSLLSGPEPSGEPHQLSAPQPSTTSSAICTGTRRNLVYYLRRDSRNSSTVCTGTLRNLISNLHQNRHKRRGSHLHRNPPEPHQLSAPKLSGTSSAICTGTLQRTSSAICTGRIRNRREPSPCSCTGSELFWAKDPKTYQTTRDKNCNQDSGILGAGKGHHSWETKEN